MPAKTNIEANLAAVLKHAYVRGFRVKSDFARKHAEYVAMAASLGLLSTKLVGNVFSSEWRPTALGIVFLEEVLGTDALHELERTCL